MQVGSTLAELAVRLSLCKCFRGAWVERLSAGRLLALLGRTTSMTYVASLVHRTWAYHSQDLCSSLATPLPGMSGVRSGSPSLHCALSTVPCAHAFLCQLPHSLSHTFHLPASQSTVDQILPFTVAAIVLRMHASGAFLAVVPFGGDLQSLPCS